MKMTIQNIISSELKKLMKDNRISTKALSDLSGVSFDIVSKIIGAKSLPELENVEKLCNVFKMSVCQFFDIVINDVFAKQNIA